MDSEMGDNGRTQESTARRFFYLQRYNLGAGRTSRVSVGRELPQAQRSPQRHLRSGARQTLQREGWIWSVPFRRGEETLDLQLIVGDIGPFGA